MSRLIGTDSSTINERADQAGEQSDQRTLARRDHGRLTLLKRVRRHRAAADDPEAAADVAEIDDRQRRQHPQHEAADERRLERGWHHGSSLMESAPGPRHLPGRALSRSTRARDG